MQKPAEKGNRDFMKKRKRKLPGFVRGGVKTAKDKVQEIEEKR